MQIINIEPIKWMFAVPEPTFTCMICRLKEATHKAHYRADVVDYTLMVCPTCAELEVSEIEAFLF